MATIQADYFVNEYYTSNYFVQNYFGITAGAPLYAEVMEFDLSVNRTQENSLAINRNLEVALTLNTEINFEIER